MTMIPALENITEMLIQKNNEISFVEETHTYTVNNYHPISVTTKIKDFQIPFDEEGNSYRYALKNNLNQEDVKQAWKKVSKDSCILGTDVHKFLEDLFYVYTQNTKTTLSTNDEYYLYKKQALKFWQELDKKRYIPVFAEYKVHSEFFRYVGTLDLLLYDTLKKGFIIADYKTNKDLHKNFKGQTLLTPFIHMLDCPLSIYILQLSTYQIPLEDMGLKVVDRWVVHFSEEEYKIIPVNDMSNTLREIY